MNKNGKPAVSVEIAGMTMRFGSFTALDDVSIKVPAGSFHALLGENGAGKSTLVKCMMGFYTPTSGQILVGEREVDIKTPKDASALGLGMVYQHFTLVPSLTGAENLVISRENVPRIIDWKTERASLRTFMERMPFNLPLDVPVRELAAGEKQKLEIVKQLYLGRSFLVLDEPTSVLTPGEAHDVLSLVKCHDPQWPVDGADDQPQVSRGHIIRRSCERASGKGGILALAKSANSIIKPWRR